MARFSQPSVNWIELIWYVYVYNAMIGFFQAIMIIAKKRGSMFFVKPHQCGFCKRYILICYLCSPIFFAGSAPFAYITWKISFTWIWRIRQKYKYEKEKRWFAFDKRVKDLFDRPHSVPHPNISKLQKKDKMNWCMDGLKTFNSDLIGKDQKNGF